MRQHIYTLDDYDPEWDCEVITVKVIPGTPEEQLASLEARLANIDKWLGNMAENGGTLHGGLHSSARFNELCRRREHVAEHVEWLTAYVANSTPDPEPPNADLGWRWHVMDCIEADEERRFGPEVQP